MAAREAAHAAIAPMMTVLQSLGESAAADFKAKPQAIARAILEQHGPSTELGERASAYLSAHQRRPRRLQWAISQARARMQEVATPTRSAAGATGPSPALASAAPMPISEPDEPYLENVAAVTLYPFASAVGEAHSGLETTPAAHRSVFQAGVLRPCVLSFRFLPKRHCGDGGSVAVDGDGVSGDDDGGGMAVDGDGGDVVGGGESEPEEPDYSQASSVNSADLPSASQVSAAGYIDTMPDSEAAAMFGYLCELPW